MPVLFNLGTAFLWHHAYFDLYNFDQLYLSTVNTKLLTSPTGVTSFMEYLPLHLNGRHKFSIQFCKPWTKTMILCSIKIVLASVKTHETWCQFHQHFKRPFFFWAAFLCIEFRFERTSIQKNVSVKCWWN
jgi:hypothetical protein